MPQLVSHKAPKRYCLLSLMSIFMIGSAVWLKLILFAELWETPQHDILYERQRTECGPRCHQNGRNGAPPFDVAEGLRLSVDMDACKLQHPPPPPSRRLEGLDEDEVAWALAPPSPSGSTEVFMEEWDDDRRRLDDPKGNESKKVVTPENKCRPENAQIHVNATLDRIYSPVAGLYLVLYATNHWEIAHIIMALFPYDKDKSNQTIIANAFGMVLAGIQAWMLAEPCLYVMKGRALKVSMRHTELLVLLAIGVAVMVVTGGVVGEIF